MSSSGTASLCRQVGGGSISVQEKRSATADGFGSVEGKEVLIGATGSGGSDGPDGSGNKGQRHELRVQMNIERQRARLFEDIQTLPYW